MKIIYAGTPDFAVPALRALIQSSHEVSLVLTQPDRPAGRGLKLKPSPVKSLALEHGIPLLQPETLKDEAVQARIAAEHADALVVAAYGLIIPATVLSMPRYGCYNIHASLLPRWRGAAPIQRALLAGDKETGVTIMEVVPALDAGAMILRGTLPITEHDTAQTLHDGLAEIGAELMLQAMDKLEREGRLEAEPQDESLVTYAQKLQKAEAVIDWRKNADELSRQVRAFNPFPVAHSTLKGETCRIWMAQAVSGTAEPGMIASVDNGILVGCGRGLLRIDELQLPGGKRLQAKDFLAGNPLCPGDRFGS
ncbi:methionyl-tRNA formyltransferase [Methylobacillus flagellatus]|uniref:Methionyl-tRNA formyltransferase n=1 Tax=Methylobacillus flagellatus (strain ATCC 51484 / DSM 6875 / VKM B-1610 / KT) TaxID=265072 RepID=FMT_METFK|nr:methionyl-tRNA formyltransferase [Methylobacillus flagellatus]Q1H4Y0.1 RecName: Full=Methionyl-tRNA formyltransferase [Methylobacillus flagellatus KT]ABE48457.1 methionyl-tRNA formyltransferase [Methylobacillus flagellatus KT]